MFNMDFIGYGKQYFPHPLCIRCYNGLYEKMKILALGQLGYDMLLSLMTSCYGFILCDVRYPGKEKIDNNDYHIILKKQINWYCPLNFRTGLNITLITKLLLLSSKSYPLCLFFSNASGYLFFHDSLPLKLKIL